MKCIVPKCRREAWYVIIDAYLEEDGGIHRNELGIYPLCNKHDSMWHTSKLDNLIPHTLKVYDKTYELRTKLHINGRPKNVLTMKQIQESLKEIRKEGHL